MSGKRAVSADIFGVSALCLAWVLAWIVADPRGEFPLNDDWAWSIPVQHLVDEGRLELTEWGGMTLVFHVLWGALFCLPFGFSFLALRLATLSLALVGIVSFHGVLREAGFGSRSALMATATLAFNPIYFHLSHTFMTDVPFCAIVLLSAFLWLRWLRSRSRVLLAVTVLVLVLATLIRQVGIAIGLTAAASCLLRLGVGRRSVGVAALVALAPMLALFAYNEMAEATIGLPRQYVATQSQLLDQLAGGIAQASKVFFPRLLWRGMASFVYLGLFCLPVALSSGAWTRSGYRSTAERRLLTVAAAVGAAIPALAVLTNRLFPDFGNALPSGNIVHRSGLGPVTLSGSEALPGAPYELCLALTILGALGGVWVVHRLLVGLWRVGQWLAGRSPLQDGRFVAPWLLAFASLGALLSAAPLLLAWAFFDRYLMTSLCFVLLAIVVPGANLPRVDRTWRILALGVLVAFAFLAIAGTQDYFGWNRARWAILQGLQREGVGFAGVDGGYEFNMWYRSRARRPELPVSDDRVVSFSGAPGFGIVDSVSHPRRLGPGEGRVVLLRRTGD